MTLVLILSCYSSSNSPWNSPRFASKFYLVNSPKYPVRARPRFLLKFLPGLFQLFRLDFLKEFLSIFFSAILKNYFKVSSINFSRNSSTDFSQGFFNNVFWFPSRILPGILVAVPSEIPSVFFFQGFVFAFFP